MTTRRLIDATQDSLALRLLRSAHLDVPPRGSMARTAAAVGISSAAVVGTATFGASGVATTSSKGMLWLLLKGMLLGGAAGSVVIGGGSFIAERAQAPAVEETVVSDSSPVSPAVVAATATFEESPPDEVESLSGPEVRPVRTAPVPPAPDPEQTDAVAAFDAPERDRYLAAEVAAIDRARTLLRAGRADAALGELDDYERTTPTRELAAEAAALRVEALVAAGRRSEAAALARRLLKAPGAETRRAYLESVASSD